jgi:hypothetical protein
LDEYQRAGRSLSDFLSERSQTTKLSVERKRMTIDKATLDKLLEGVDASKRQSMFTDAGLFGRLKKALEKEWP